LFSFGARSFSVWSENVVQKFDSGDALEQITKAAYPRTGSLGPQVGGFNSTHTNNTNDQANPNNWTHDSRSDDKGPEPEGVTVAKLFGRDFAFITLERIGGVMIFELTDPVSPRFVQYMNTRVFGTRADVPATNPPQVVPGVEDLGPEGVIVIKEEDSPNGKPLLVVASEVSGTTRVYEIEMKQ
jgi:hypothetical protein